MRQPLVQHPQIFIFLAPITFEETKMPLTKVSFAMIDGAYINVLDYGATGTALTDDSDAIQAAINAAELRATTFPNRGAVVYFPEGQYLVTKPLTIKQSRVALRGAGSYLSQLVRNTNYGNTIEIQKVSGGTLQILEKIEISELSFFHDTASVAMTSAHLLVTAVTHGRFNELDINNGRFGVLVYGCVDVQFYGCNIIGSSTGGTANSLAGMLLTHAAESGFSVGSVVPLPTQISVSECEIFGPLNSGWEYSLLINAAEDVTISNSYLGNSKFYNVFLQQTAANYIILEVNFTNGTYIDGAGVDSVRIEGLLGNGSTYIGSVNFDGIDIKGQSGQTTGSGIFVDGTVRVGTYAQACRNLRVSNCRIGDYDDNGIWIVGCENATISNNIIGGNNYNNTSGGRGVLLGAAANRISMVGNRIGGLPEGGGTSLQSAGIELVAGASNVLLNSNDVRFNVTGIVDNTALATTSARTVTLTNNTGFNGNLPSLSPPIPASGVNQFNPYGTPCWITIYIGTVTDISLNGQTIDTSTTTPVQFPVGPTDRVTMTYSVAPLWIWWRQ
jgi:parallel beta-helix repeat protein